MTKVENEKWGILPSKALDKMIVSDYNDVELPDEEVNDIVSKWRNLINNNKEKFNRGIIGALYYNLKFDCTFQEDDDDVFDTEIRPFLKGDNNKKDIEWYRNYMEENSKNDWDLEMKNFLSIFDIEKYLDSDIVEYPFVKLEDNNDGTQKLIIEIHSYALIEADVLYINEDLEVECDY